MVTAQTTNGRRQWLWNR